MGSLTVQLSHVEVGTRLGSLFVSVGYRSALPRPEVSAILAFFCFFDKRDVREQRESGKQLFKGGLAYIANIFSLGNVQKS